MSPQHPLGVGADPAANHHTRANRHALAYCLSLYYDGSLTEVIHRRSDGTASVGLPLASRFVSLLEIAHALQRLGAERPDLLILIELTYKLGWRRDQVAQRLHLDSRSVRLRLDEALHALIDVIWKDFV